MTLTAVLAFFSGAAYEACCVAWVHYSERHRPFVTALLSMTVGACQVFGVGEAVRDWRTAPFFIFGYGAGTFAAVEWKRRRALRGSL